MHRLKFVLPLLVGYALLLGACSDDTPPPKTQEITESQTIVQDSDSKQKPNKERQNDVPVPAFRNVSVHDPSVIRVDGTFYLFGSHLASAKSEDLLQWTQVSSVARNGNKLIPNVEEEMIETFTWAQTNTFWATDVIQLEDEKFYMYYNACKGDSPRSALGIAVSDHIEGPYKDLGIILKSGMWGLPSEDGTIYDATIQPNTVDPHVFFDKENGLWMVYGSYSGGIFILKLDPKTGFPFPDQGYGKKLLGGNHSRIEAPYIMYSPETDFYYLFLSYGGLGADGGYNIRVARSENPDGPYYDSNDEDMIKAKGRHGSFFDDRSVEIYGVKLMGNFDFQHVEGELAGISSGYVSPGHNSAYYDADTGKYFNFFHTRFEGRGEAHEVRVHQMFMNSDDWPIIAPHRYSGETIEHYSINEIAGDYKFIDHGLEISTVIKKSTLITLKEDGTVIGDVTGSWRRIGDYMVEMNVNGIDYNGVFIRQYDMDTLRNVITFTALSYKGVAIWGSKVAKTQP